MEVSLFMWITAEQLLQYSHCIWIVVVSGPFQAVLVIWVSSLRGFPEEAEDHLNPS